MIRVYLPKNCCHIHPQQPSTTSPTLTNSSSCRIPLLPSSQQQQPHPPHHPPTSNTHNVFQVSRCKKKIVTSYFNEITSQIHPPHPHHPTRFRVPRLRSPMAPMTSPCCRFASPRRHKARALAGSMTNAKSRSWMAPTSAEGRWR